MATGMFDSFITGHWFSPQARQCWSDIATLQAWLDVEAALARAQATRGLIPPAAAATITERARAGLFDLERMATDIRFTQHPLVPVLHQFEALCGEPAAGYIHWGATTQNIFDTSVALQMRRSHGLLSQALDEALAALAGLAVEHRATPMAGRTHGQHALPMTFGFKLAGWIDELRRDQVRLEERLAPSFPACMGGAIGTFAAMGDQGPEVEAEMARQLGLLPAGMPARASYDRAADYVAAMGLLAGTAQKIGQDVVFMQRTEVGEVAEAFHMGKVGSSTMAQKRNPSTALLLVSLCRMLRGRVPLALEAMVRMDEGDSSATNVTDTTLPETVILAVSVAETLARLATGLAVDASAMQRNLALTQGQIVSEAVMMQLARLIGRHEAHQVLYEAVQRSQTERLPFLECIVSHPLLRQRSLPEGLTLALDPVRYTGRSEALTTAIVQALPPNRRAAAPRE